MVAGLRDTRAAFEVSPSLNFNRRSTFREESVAFRCAIRSLAVF